MLYPNFTLSGFSKNKEFSNDINSFTRQFFNSLNIAISVKENDFKYFRTPDNTCIYLFHHDKKVNQMTVYKQTIHDFQKEESTEKLLDFQIKNIKESGGDNIYMHDIIYFNMEEGGRVVNCSTQIQDIRELMNVIDKDSYLKNKYSNEFLMTLNEKIKDFVHPYVESVIGDIEYIASICKEKKFTSKSKSIVYNDLDNHVWVSDGMLVLTDQNTGFLCDVQNKDNFSVYFLDKEYKSTEKEINRIKEAIKNNSIDTIEDTVLSVKDGKVTYANSSLMYCLDINLDFSQREIEERGYQKQKHAVDLQSYQYLKDYFYTHFGFNEFQFLCQAFLTLGGGFDYNAKEGAFKYKGVKYLKELDQETDLAGKKFKEITYCYPKNITYLNNDWENGLKLMLEIIKRDKPQCRVFDKETSEESLANVVSYYETQLSKMKSKNKPK